MESSRYQPPVRHSLSDEELSARVNQATDSHQGLESVMELLVTQEALRAQEDQELAAWVMTMESEGSQESIAALATYRGQPIPAPFSEPIQPAYIAEPLHNEQPEVTPEPEAVIQQPETPAAEPFSWFTKTDEVEIVVEESVIDVPVVDETQPEVFVDEVITSEEVDLVEEPETELHVEGEETVDEFEQLLVSAAAEEELTALEDSRKEETVSTKPSNVQIPTDEHRNRKPVSQLGAWLGLSATIVPMLLAYVLVARGLSFTTVLLDLGVGYLVAGLLIAVASLAGKRSGLSTATISRAVFGVWGNAAPLTLVLIARVILSALAVSAFAILMNGVEPKLPSFETSLVALGGFNITVGLVVCLALLVAAFLLALVRKAAGRILQVLVSLLAFGFIFEGSIGASLAIHNLTPGSLAFFSRASIESIGLVVLVVITLFVSLAPNSAKAIPMKYKGSRVFLHVLVSNFIIPFAVATVATAWFSSLVVYDVAGGPDAIIVNLKLAFSALPIWVRGAVGSSIALSIFYIVSMSLRTAAQDVLSLFRFRSKTWALVISLLLTVCALVLFSFQPARQTIDYLVNMFVLAAVLSIAWMAMFVSDVALRKIAYHELSLTRSYGFYGKFNVLSFTIWVITTSLATALVPVDLLGFGFTGFLSSSLGLAGSQMFGLAISFAFAIILTLAARIPQIRKQEREVLEVESRREQLNDIFVGQE